jgi:hypothetical protein
VPSAIPQKGESLREISPKISKEWHPTKNHPFTAKDVKSGSSKSRWWKCKKGHEWQAAPKTRLRGDQCPICSGRKVLVGFNDLKTTHPDIAKEADGWDPTSVSAGSGNMEHWKCKSKHQWTAVVSSRASGRGCPVCANKKVLAGYNDLATTYPDLAKEADGWDPTTVISGSRTKLKWKCALGHRWSTDIQSRKTGNGCPVCANKEVVVGFNDLATTNPDIAKEADGWDPKTIVVGSETKYSWICTHGHKWITTPSSRRKSGCPTCANKKVLAGYNDLATTHPDIAKEADGWDPTTVTHGHSSSKAWKCSEGHKWKTSVSGRTGRGNGCPTCVNKSVKSGYNDLATTHPDIAKEADDWDSTTVTAGSGLNRKFKCKKGHQYISTPSARTRGRGCSVCAGKSIIIGLTDLATTHPDIAKEADGWDPTTLTASSNKKQIWKCKHGHQWKTNPLHRTHGIGQGCPTCGNKVALAGFNDLASTRPDLALQADGWDPTTVVPQSGKRQSWKCDKGHVWKQTIAARFRGLNCPICANKQLLVGYNDLATTHPDLAKEADGWDPTSLIAGSNIKQQWLCKLGHSYRTPTVSRLQGTNCPICSGNQVLSGFNDLLTKNPEIAREAHGWDPSSVTERSGKKRKWKCDQGHVWPQVVANRTGQGHGCPICSETGFNPGKPGWLYLIKNNELDMFQIGISNQPEVRLKKHARSDWTTIELRGPMDGFLTQQLETSCLHALEKRGAILGHKAGIDKFDGYSEAWTKASLNVTSIKQIMDWVYEDETK